MINVEIVAKAMQVKPYKVEFKGTDTKKGEYYKMSMKGAFTPEASKKYFDRLEEAGLLEEVLLTKTSKGFSAKFYVEDSAKKVREILEGKKRGAEKLAKGIPANKNLQEDAEKAVAYLIREEKRGRKYRTSANKEYRVTFTVEDFKNKVFLLKGNWFEIPYVFYKYNDGSYAPLSFLPIDAKEISEKTKNTDLYFTKGLVRVVSKEEYYKSLK